jgi:vesicle coat complex subunit
VNTTLCNLTDYLASLLKNTNMKCLTPDKALSGECGFMAANLYAKVKDYLLTVFLLLCLVVLSQENFFGEKNLK